MGRVLRWAGLLVLGVLVLALGFVGWQAFLPPMSLRILADRQMIAAVADSPETITSLGLIDGTPLDFHSGKLDDVSLAERDRSAAKTRRLAAELERYRDPAKYTGQDRLTYAVLRAYYDQAEAFTRFDWTSAATSYVYAVDQQWAPPAEIALLLQNLHQVRNAKTARSYVARIEAAGAKLDALGVEALRQADAGVILPAFLFDKTLKGMRDFIAPTPEENAVYKDYLAKLDALDRLSNASREELASQALTAVRDDLYPAFNRLIATMEGLRPRATNDAGVWKLPDGAAFYEAAIRAETTTDYTADQIHAIGLAEVARIEAEMAAILDAEKAPPAASIGARVAARAALPDQRFEDSEAGRAAILDGYRAMLAEIEAEIIPQTFSRTPKAAVEIRRMQPFEEIGAPQAYYMPPALDGSRAGVFYANLRDVAAVPRLSMKTLVAHEASPGHHFQVALAQELSGLPLVRQVGGFTAYNEGWALYAERLVWEHGLYADDPMGDLGRLRDEMFRAVRLVVDTGIHAKRWTREQAIAYMLEKTGMAAGEVENEIDRYITGPGQALGYKIGQLKILELRARAQERLGARFDLKAFHAAVLENGALPLTVLETVIDDWIAAQGAPTTG